MPAENKKIVGKDSIQTDWTPIELKLRDYRDTLVLAALEVAPTRDAAAMTLGVDLRTLFKWMREMRQRQIALPPGVHPSWRSHG